MSMMDTLCLRDQLKSKDECMRCGTCNNSGRSSGGSSSDRLQITNASGSTSAFRGRRYGFGLERIVNLFVTFVIVASIPYVRAQGVQVCSCAPPVYIWRLDLTTLSNPGPDNCPLDVTGYSNGGAKGQPLCEYDHGIDFNNDFVPVKLTEFSIIELNERLEGRKRLGVVRDSFDGQVVEFSSIINLDPPEIPGGFQGEFQAVNAAGQPFALRISVRFSNACETLPFRVNDMLGYLRFTEIDQPPAEFCDFASASPSIVISAVPSHFPTTNPSKEPSDVPSTFASAPPTLVPSELPSPFPTTNPSKAPTDVPSNFASEPPTMVLSAVPSPSPTTSPSVTPTYVPTLSPTKSFQPSVSMPPANGRDFTFSPSTIPSTTFSETPSLEPTNSPLMSPSMGMSEVPSSHSTSPPSDGCVGKGKGKNKRLKGKGKKKSKGKGKGKKKSKGEDLNPTRKPSTQTPGKGKGAYSSEKSGKGKGKSKKVPKSKKGKGKSKKGPKSNKGKGKCKKYSMVAPIQQLGIPLSDVIMDSPASNHGKLRGLR